MATEGLTSRHFTKVITACFVLSFGPIILSLFMWLVYGWWTNESFLEPEIIRAILFILTADLAIVVGGILIRTGYPILKQRVTIRLPGDTIIMLFAISTTAGLLIDFYVFYIGSGGIDAPFWQSYNFVITIPSFLLSFVSLSHLFRIKNKATITILSVILAIVFMVFTFWFFAKKIGSPPTEFYGVIYIIGFVPALVMGLVYGLAISRMLNTDIRAN